MRPTLFAAMLLLLGTAGCYREMIVYQARDWSDDTSQFEIDTSQLPADVVSTSHESLDFVWVNPSALRVIRPHYPIKIIIVPATQP